MEAVWKRVVQMLAVIGGAIAGALGGWDVLLMVLVAMMAADYLSGVVVAVMGRSAKTEYGGLSSAVGLVGLLKKGLMMLVVLVAALLDTAIGAQTHVFRDAACWFYIANEGLSLLENLSMAGVPFPARLKEMLGHKLRESDGTEGAGTAEDAPMDGNC